MTYVACSCTRSTKIVYHWLMILKEYVTACCLALLFSVLLSSVCPSVVVYIVAKRYILEQKCLKK